MNYCASVVKRCCGDAVWAEWCGFRGKSIVEEEMRFSWFHGVNNALAFKRDITVVFYYDTSRVFTPITLKVFVKSRLKITLNFEPAIDKRHQGTAIYRTHPDFPSKNQHKNSPSSSPPPLLLLPPSTPGTTRSCTSRISPSQHPSAGAWALSQRAWPSPRPRCPGTQQRRRASPHHSRRSYPRQT